MTDDSNERGFPNMGMRKESAAPRAVVVVAVMVVVVDVDVRKKKVQAL